MGQQADLSSQLDDLMSQIQDARASSTASRRRDSGAAALAGRTELDLIAKSNQAAWAAAHVGAGLAGIARTATRNQFAAEIVLAIVSAHVTTSRYGPTTCCWSRDSPLPALHNRHRHRGPLGIPVMAAPTGSSCRRAHPYRLRLLRDDRPGAGWSPCTPPDETDVNLGDRVTRGHRIGLEGSTGLSTDRTCIRGSNQQPGDRSMRYLT